MTSLRLTIVACLLVSGGCQPRSFEQRFFKEPLGDRVERARQLPLAEQYKVFRYSNDVIHPPLMDMADPIAERGAAAVPFLLSELKNSHDDIAVRDILLIFERMARLKTYDVKSDQDVMQTFNSRIPRMRNEQWKAVCMTMLKSIEGS